MTSSSHPARTTPGPIRMRRLRAALLLLLAVAALAAALADRWPAPSTPATSVALRHGAPRGAPPRALGEADGAVPDGATVFDDGVPGVARLDPALLAALRRAATDAQADGVTFVLDSGWRSPAYQAQLLRDAIAQHGSAAEAERWVATPKTSAHVSGDAVDLGRDAASWLAARGAAYGLCRVYGNESWHFELRPAAAGRGCPPTYADPTHDPRMHP